MNIIKYVKSWNKSIKGKMIASNMLLFTLTVISISLFVLLQTRQSLEDVTIQKMEQSRLLKTDSLRLWIGEIKSDMIWLTKMETLKSRIIAFSKNDDQSSANENTRKQITLTLDSLKAIKRDWQEAFVLNAEGEIILSTREERLGDFRTMDKYFVEGKKRLYLQKIYPSPITFGPTMTISAPIRDDLNTTVAVIAFHIDLLRVDEIIFERGNDIEASESYLVDSFGALVSGKKFGDPSILRGVKSKGVELAIKGGSGTGTYKNFDGVSVIGSYAWLNELDAGLIVETPVDVAFAPLLDLTINILIFALVILTILILLIYVFAGQISDPIQNVTRMTKQISKGNFSTKLEVKSSDETGILANSVNSMSDNLEKALSELSDARNKAVAATVAKSNFLANMSHEIRTPMNSVLGYAQLMARSPNMDDQNKEYIERIQLSGKHLMDLINTILDLSKIESGKSELNESVFELDELCSELSSMFEFRCSEKSLRWRVEKNFKKCQIYADKLKIQQILINLINNAIKFTEEGEVKLKISKLSDTRYFFEVIDTGRGISEEGKNRIFEPFNQQFENDQFIGTGLGLTIASNLLKDMRTEIKIDSEEGKGSRFWFELESRKERSKPSEKIDLGKVSSELGVALVVDDIADNREIVRCFLDELGFEVLEAENGKEAVAIVEDMKALEQPISVIFLDILMPVMTGDEAFRRIRDLRLNPKPKIFAVSASTLAHEKSQIINMGFDGFLSKPVAYSDIAESLGIEPESADDCQDSIQNSNDVFDLNIPREIINEAIDASKIYHISKLTECISKIELLGNSEKQFSDSLKGYLKDLNMEAIESEFMRLSQKSSSERG